MEPRWPRSAPALRAVSFFLAAVVTLAIATAPRPAYAQDGSAERQKRVEAGERFERGVRFYRDGDYSAALAEFEAAYRLAPHVSVLFNIGVTEKRLFRYGDAVETLNRYLAEGGDDIRDDRRAEVKRELAEIRSLTAELVVRVKGPEGTEILLDGKKVATTPVDAPLLLRPGLHTVTARAEGFLPATSEVTVISGEKAEIALTLRPEPKVARVARLEVTSEPAGARLTVDGMPVGETPWSGELEPGGHRVIAELSGYQITEREIILTAGQARHLSLTLEQRMQATPLYKRWWVWTLAGAIVAGGTTTAIIYSQERPDVTLHSP